MKLLVASAALLLAACGSKSQEAAEPTPAADPAPTEAAGPPAPESGEIDPEWKRMGGMAVDLMRKLHAVLTANASNCDSMADGLVAMVQENKAFIDETKSFKGTAEFNQWFGQTYQEEMQKLMSEIQPALVGCKDNVKVQEAFKSFQG